jgi:hypothetical protein
MVVPPGDRVGEYPSPSLFIDPEPYPWMAWWWWCIASVPSGFCELRTGCDSSLSWISCLTASSSVLLRRRPSNGRLVPRRRRSALPDPLVPLLECGLRETALLSERLNFLFPAKVPAIGDELILFKTDPCMSDSGIGDGHVEEVVLEGSAWLRVWCGVCCRV